MGMAKRFSKFSEFFGLDPEEEIEAPMVEAKEVKEEKVVDFNSIKTNQRQTQSQMARFQNVEVEHILLAPNNFSDAERISDEIKAQKMVTLNMSEISFEEAVRILDFISGTAYAVDAKITKVSENVFMTSPNKVKQSNELPVRESGNEILSARDKSRSNDEEEIVRKFK